MLPVTFSNGDAAARVGHAAVLTFAGKRRVLSSAAWNGGLREDLHCAFNYDMSHGKTALCALRAPTFSGHMRLVAQELGLPPESAGLCTAAQIDHLATASETWDGVTVTVLVTAGIDDNGGRAGDPASWWERDGALGLPVGTINLLLHFDCDLPEGTLVSALLTATEAKCAAVQELQLPSLYSSGLATGSGTDGAVLICQPGAKRRLTDAGKHSKLGEMIGRSVLRAVKEALYLQSGAAPERLRHALRHLGRFGLTEEALLARTPGLSPAALDAACRGEASWTAAALCAHLLDLVQWGVLTENQAAEALARPLPPPVPGLPLTEGVARHLLTLATGPGGLETR